MLARLLTETLVIWVLFFLYVWLSTVPLGPVGGAFYYEQDIQDRLVELGLITHERIARPLEEREVVAVIDDAHLIGVGIRHAIVHCDRFHWGELYHIRPHHGASATCRSHPRLKVNWLMT